MHFEQLTEKKIFKKRRERKRWKKRENFKKNFKKKNKKQKAFKSKNLSLIVPSIFSLSSDIEGVLRFAEKCKKLKSKKINHLFLDFSRVVEISHGTMALLLSVIHDLNLFNISVGGNNPLDKDALEIFLNCGFLKFFKSSLPKQIKIKNTIMVQGGEKIDQVASADVIENAMETVFGKKTRNQKLQGTIIEMMTNSVNHAFEGAAKNTRWYLSIFHEDESKKVKFCFVDNGKGILNTIHKKFMQSFTGLIHPEAIIKKAFNGDYGSSTKLLERGTGLISIRNAFTNNTIGNLKVLTNNLYYDFITGNVVELNNDFNGTFYFWELDINCNNVNY